MIDENALNIYTDGSSKPKPRRGGVGIQFIYVNDYGIEVTEDIKLPGYPGATSNEMELNASLIALRKAHEYFHIRNFNKIIIFTDSQYIVNNYKYAMFLWPKTRWLKKSGAPILNANLWKDIVSAIRKTGKIVEFKKVKAHSADLHNKAVDDLAKNSANNPINKPLTVKIVRRKKSKEKTRLGSVDIIGQKITIRIIEGQRLPVQKLYRYRYEVMSRKSKYFRKVDFIYSTEILREAHTYYVRINKEKDNPRIEKVFREILPKVKTQSIPNTVTAETK
jgi:ribonuclease HI